MPRATRENPKERSAVLGRKNYTKEEIDRGKAAVAEQLAAYRKFVKAGGGSGSDKKADSALASFEAEFFNNMTLVLDRYYVHRLSGGEGKDGNALNEVRIIVDSLISHDGVMRSDKKIKLPPERSIVGLAAGEQINLTEADFKRLSAAFFAELERRFG
jgi:hypothetical protein